MGRSRRIALTTAIQRRWPDLGPGAAEAAVASGDVVVDGVAVTNPRSLVAVDAAIRLVSPPDLQGRRKLAWALDHFRANVDGRVALDVGASTGGFTTALLEAGAARVYAVDVGHGQLLGSLRQDPRVINLERTNVGALTSALIPDALGVISVDVSYLSLSSAVAQLTDLDLTIGAELVGLVKPMFELRLATIPADAATLDQARVTAINGIQGAGWTVAGSAESPVRGNRGAVEYFIFARR